MATPRNRTERVLLIMAPGRNRDFVGEWLDGEFGYEVTTATDPSSLPDAYDICLLDEHCIDAFEESLRRRKECADAYLPHLLFLSEDEVTKPSLRASTTETAVDHPLIDDVVDLPVEKATLARRIENLLATRRASVTLTERDQQYRELVELTPEAILLVEDGRIGYANAAATELFGVDNSGLEGDSLDRFVAEGESDGLSTLLSAVPAIGEGATEFTEFRFRTATGGEVETAVAGVAVSYDGGRAIQLLIRDLTETNRREQRLQLFGRAVEAAAHGIVICDTRIDDEPIVYANAGFSRITGYSLGEVLGRNCRFLQGENTADEPVERLRAAIDAGEPTSVDILNYRKDGTPFWNRVEIVPIRDEAGDLTHFLGLQQDITERIRNEQRLAVLDRILRHNVRNKTNVIRGYADAIVEGEASPESAATRIRTAADELFTISEQIRQFDTVLRVSEEASETIDVAGVVGEGVTALREGSPSADVTFRASGDVTIDAHPTLRAVLQDLLYQLGESEAPEAEISLVREGENVRLDVIDRGGAISRADLELVSSRSETPLEHLQGLELWLLRWAVEQSGGEFSVDPLDHPRIRIRFLAADASVAALRDS